MKKVIGIILIFTLLFAFSACKKQKKYQSTAPAEQLTEFSEKYDGSVEKDVTLKDIKIVIMKYNFSIEGKDFTFAQFKKNEKLTTDLGTADLDVYVKDNTLQKCEISEKDKFGNYTYTVTYSAEGKPVQAKKNAYDDKGMLTQTCLFDENGKLSGFYTYEYDDTYKLSKRYEYASDKSFKSAETYAYDSNGKLAKTYKYDASGKLQ